MGPQVPALFSPSRSTRAPRRPSTRAAVFPECCPEPCSKVRMGGGIWAPANTGLPSVFVRSLVIDPQTPSTIYAGTSGGVFKSTNGGGNWVPANGGLVVLAVLTLAMDPHNPATLYAGTTAA
jgi:hypothetical protein